MAMNKSKDGRVNAENISGSKVPRRALTDETTGKGAGTRNIRSIGGRFFNFASKGRR